MQETEDAPRFIVHEKWHRGTTDSLNTGRGLNASEVVLGLFDAGQERATEIPRRHENWVGVKGHLSQWVGVGLIFTNGPLGLENAETAFEVIATNKGDVGAEELGEFARRPVEGLLASLGRGRHEVLGDTGHQFVETLLMQKATLAL